MYEKEGEWMYKVVLVDDEEYILNTLENSIDWQRFNMDTPVCFNDGTDALNYIKTNNVDLLITDVKMPNMTGIELIQKAKQINDETIYVILSAYDSFEYAIDALKLSVFDYILKPLDYDKLEETLKNAEEKLKQMLKSSDTYFNFITHSDNAMSLIKEEMSVSEFLEVISLDGIRFENDDPPAFIIKLKINDLTDYLENLWKHGIDRLYSTISYFLENVAKKKIMFVPLTLMFSDLTFLALSTDNYYDSENKVKEFADLFKKSIFEYIKSDIEITEINFFSSLSLCQKVASLYVDIPKKTTDGSYNSIEVAIKYIHDNYTSDISLTQISKHVCLSPSYFSRYFKSKTGKNLIDYVNDLRIEKSRDLLVSTNENIATIYKTVGFKSKNHFYRLFKERYEVTPQQYRNTN